MVRTESVLEAAERLGCKRRKVFELLASGLLERAPRYGRQIRIYSDSVDAALARPAGAERRSRKRKSLAPKIDAEALRARLGL